MSIGHGFEDVLAAAQAGAPWALQRLYEDLAPAVTGYLRLRGDAEPDDTASETFLSVFHQLARFSGDEAALRSWVFTIAHRRMIDGRRRRGRRPVTEPLDGPAAPGGNDIERAGEGDVEEEALAALDDTWLTETLGVLTTSQREVVLLRVVAQLSVREVAEVLGTREGAVRALQYRGLERLRRHIAARATGGDASAPGAGELPS